jgi:hypothetical protein
MCSETKETGTTTRFFTPDAPNSTNVSSVYGLRVNVGVGEIREILIIIALTQLI